ncbi:hypothetical protein GCM10027605_27850 [Micromonospora zhanjiangensis]
MPAQLVEAGGVLDQAPPLKIIEQGFAAGGRAGGQEAAIGHVGILPMAGDDPYPVSRPARSGRRQPARLQATPAGPVGAAASAPGRVRRGVGSTGTPGGPAGYAGRWIIIWRRPAWRCPT